jgi:hypothetical protein
LSESFAHVATVWLSWHEVPAWVHAVAVHPHDAVPIVLVQVWWAPHIAV